MKVLSVVGARPQFVKLAAIAEAMASTPHDHIIVHTGQHYDPLLSEAFFDELSIPSPDVQLGVGSGGHGAQTGAMLAAMDGVLERYEPNWVLVYGDTNSTIAAALSAVKLGFPVAHLEAGLRSFNRKMPEEHNRVLTDHCSDLLLAPTAVAVANLRKEGLASRTVAVGDVMTDVLIRVRDGFARSLPVLPPAVPAGRPYVLATIHRAENTDDPSRLGDIVDALAGLPLPVVLLVHPRLRARAAAFGIALDAGPIVPTSPLPYPQMALALEGAVGLVTDSGGLQKEAYLLGTPCTTIRTETEWVETLVDDWNLLLPSLVGLAAVATRQAPSRPQATPYGDGHTAEKVVRVLADWLPSVG